MLASKLLVYRMPASPAQVRIALGVALALFLIFVSSFITRTLQFPILQSFVPVTSAILIMADWITATLLFAQASVLGARPLRVLAAGYFLAGLFVSLRFWFLPGSVANNTPLWFYLASHGTLPLAIMSYAWPGRADRMLARSWPPDHRFTGGQLVGLVLLACGLTLAATSIETSLPWTSPILLTALPVLMLIVAAMALLWNRLGSVLDLWLLLMLWGWFLETVLIALPAPRLGFTAGWYAARGLGLLSGLFVLFALLEETGKLYAQTVLQLIAQMQEREHRFLIRDVISASIAHELRQPLSAILINSEVARNLALGRAGEPDVSFEDSIQLLDEIIASSMRANAILESTRAMFGRKDGDRDRVDPTVILQSTLALVESSARAQGVSVKFVIEGQPRAVVINRLQFQQALLNLFQNAIEALSHSQAPYRTLLVRCSCWEDRGVTMRVEDNGPGIAPADRKKIFDAFFTTRPEGLGMGLAIARAVICAHGGRLEVEPRSPAGTVFTINLPYANQRTDASKPARASVPA